VGTKQVRKQAKSGGEKLKNKEEKLKWWGWKKKTKRGVFTRWQWNSLTFVKFIRLHQMVTKMDLIATIGW
jgi:hypothetical protein